MPGLRILRIIGIFDYFWIHWRLQKLLASLSNPKGYDAALLGDVKGTHVQTW
jgi:hypothetical protein